MKYKLLIFFLIISNLCSAQKIHKTSTSWILKINVTSLVDPFTFPAIQASVEKKLSRSLSISAELGYQLYSFKATDTTFLSPEGFKANIECRYYLPTSNRIKTTKLEGVYLGLRPFYRQNQSNSYIAFQTKSDPVNWHDDDFGVKNKTYGLSFILGFQKSITSKIVIDFYSGLGIVERSVKNTELQYNKNEGDILGGTEFMQFLWKLNLSESSGLWVNIPLGFRIGYKF